MASRQQSIKVKIILLLVVPLAALLVLWVFSASGSFGDTMGLLKAKSFDTKVIQPTQALVFELQQERRLSLVALGVGHEGDRSTLIVQRNRTNAVRATFQRDVADQGLRAGIAPELTRQMDGLSGRLGELDALRGSVDVTGIARSAVFDEFNSLIDAGFAIYEAVSSNNAQIAAEVRALAQVSQARELLSREDALVAGALTVHRITPVEHDTLAELIGAQRFQYGVAVPLLMPADRVRFQQFMGSAEFVRLRQLEDSLVRGGRNGRPAVKAATWDAAAPTVSAKLRNLDLVAIDGTTDRAQSIAVDVLVRLGLTAGLGLVALVASIIIAVRISRRVIGEVRALSGAVGDFTTDRLPVLAEQVRRGQYIEEDEASLQLGFSVIEIDRLSDAFEGTRMAVVAAARSEAAARKGVSEVFVNLARRNQALLHRQLGLLDSMERRVEDPQELNELFRLDHLATCMRRHAEGLVILAGRTAGRTWRTPVPLIDVVRGAVAEVEDYTRVQVLPMPRAALSGAAVADTIHLLAELIENAAMFSPPKAAVQVSGHVVPNGFVVEVEDRGLGMTTELLAELNGRLAEAPEFDLFDSARLGMFVVARLAHRHDVQVSLCPSPYGGTTAVVLIPSALIVNEDLVIPAPVAEVADGAEGLKSISVVPDPVEAIEVGTSTVPSFIVDASRGAADPRSGDPRPMDGALAERAPLNFKPVRRAPADGSAAEGATHKGMPRRKRQTAQSHAEPGAGLASDGLASAGLGSDGVGSDGLGSDGQDTYLGMPKRTRQASLAPQLRSDSREPTEDELKDDSGSERTPEVLRARMAAMQSGWQRGRIVADPTLDNLTVDDPTLDDPTLDLAVERTVGRSSEITVGPAVRPAKEEDTP